jgi:hypothetical protein
MIVVMIVAPATALFSTTCITEIGAVHQIVTVSFTERARTKIHYILATSKQ